jgi:stage V sporulation protein S
MNVLKVSTTTDPAATAGAIANGIRIDGSAEVQVIGPRAVNQAVKAIAIARSYLAASGMDLYCVPSFATVQVQGDEAEAEEDRTGIHFHVCPRHDLRTSKARNASD